jgi:flagellar protein FliS
MMVTKMHPLDDMIAASPTRLVVMLYDETLAALRQAARAARVGDIETRCNAINAALEIVGYLYMTLDETRGGDVALNLGAIYAHVIARLPQANVVQDAGIIEETIGLLKPLRASWNEIDKAMAAGLAEQLLPELAVMAGAEDVADSDALAV